jgi:rhodanese-related sulfurtransferase
MPSRGNLRATASVSCTRRSATARVVALLMLSASVPARALLFFQSPEWPAVKQTMRERHPAVPQLSTPQRRDRLADAPRAQPVLLDARAPAEFEVSRLLGALEGRAKDAPVVVYGSVGARSAALTDKLIRDGWGNVSHLEGSIFEWANPGLRLSPSAAQILSTSPFNE